MLGLVMLAARVAYVLVVPDLDTDAYGHFHIGRALVDDPSDVRVHWVWLPGWHYVLMSLQRAGIGFTGVRLTQAALATLGPLLVYVHAAPKSRFVAASLFTIAALPNVAGTSALMEVAFTLLVLGAAISIDVISIDGRRETRWALTAGLLLVAAASLRYEAWFIVLGLGVELAIVTARRVLAARRSGGVPSLSGDRPRIIVFALPAICLAAYIVFRRVIDGEWLWFVRETYRFTHMQRGYTQGDHSALFDLVWFPILLPLMVLGPAAVLVVASVVQRRRDPVRARSAIVPASLLLFLLLSYMGKGALGQARYLTVLIPFACVAIAGALARMKPPLQRWLVIATFASVAGATLFVGQRNARSALAREGELRALEEWARTPTTGSRASSPPP